MFTMLDGVSLRNPLALNIAHFFMEKFEKSLFNTEDEHNPRLYLRFVGNMICIFQKDILFENFHKKINKLYKSIKFTYEFGENALPFLDIKIK